GSIPSDRAALKGENSPSLKSALQNGFLGCPVPSTDKFSHRLQSACEAGASSCGRDAERTHSLTGGEHPIETVSKFTSAAASAGLRIAPRPPHKYDGETAFRACWGGDPRSQSSAAAPPAPAPHDP